MSIKTYTSSFGNKIANVQHSYSKPGSYVIHASNNIVSAAFVDSSSSDYNNDQEHKRLQYTSISFGSNVEFIPDRCCYRFSNLRNVSFSGDRIQSIGDEAFCMCSSLIGCELPNKIQSIGTSAFEGCTKMQTFKFPSQQVNLGAQAFFKSGLASISLNLGDGHGAKIFAECKQLRTATVSCDSLGNDMFNGCSQLTSATFIGNVTTIPAMAFTGCSNLTEVKFSSMNSIKRIEDNAFSNCTALSSFEIDQTSVEYLGSSVFYGTKLTSLTLPATISSVSQMNSLFLVGSPVTYIKFLGMNSQYMESNKSVFSAFGAKTDTITLESSDGKKYKVDANGLIFADMKVYVISIAISNNLTSNPLEGMYLDSERFISLVNDAYSDKPELIAGITRLNDDGVSGSDGLGNVANLDAAFDKAKNSGADFLLFHFSDHGEKRIGNNGGYIYLYNGSYTYDKLFSKFQQFKNVFALLCCCYPNSAVQPFTPGVNNTKALFWCAGSSTQKTIMTPNVGHNFMSFLKKKFNKNYSWSEQWKAIDKTYDKVTEGTKKDKIVIEISPRQYNYGDFPMSNKVFRLQ